MGRGLDDLLEKDGLMSVHLSPREKQVMVLKARGATEEQIAVRLGLSRATIARVSRNIRDKCTSYSITQAMFVITSTGALSENDTK